MHPHGISIVFEDSSHQCRRVRFRRTSDGWMRETARHTGCRWLVTGTEPVTKVDIDVPGGAAESYPGP